jgi:radical SAM protein
MSYASYTPADFATSPLMFYYEITQACDLVCKHCRASAQACSHPLELTTDQSKRLIDEIVTFPRRPTLVLTGGDPLKRGDLFELVRYAVAAGLQVALTPSATPLATREALRAAKDAGVRRLGISLDGADARTHDAFRGWQGSFDRTLNMLADARDLGLPVQINTTITCGNLKQIDSMAHFLNTQGIEMWSVFFLVPVGRGTAEKRISPQEYEQAFERLWVHSRRQPYGIKTTEAPHYRRYVLQRAGCVPSSDRLEMPVMPGRAPRAPLGVRDGNGIMFVGHTGEIYPAGFLPLKCGRFPHDSVVRVYQHHPTFRALRDPDGFGGDCGICEYRHVCGGSRSRAFAVTGDPLAAEPDCSYRPGQARRDFEKTGFPARRPLRVLLVEDSLLSQKLAQGLLERQGHIVTLVETGEDAVAAVQARQFDIVLMDVEMPGMNGLEATRRIRSLDKPTSNVTIIGLTTVDRQQCLRAGMDDHLPKSLLGEQLIAVVERHTRSTTNGETGGNERCEPTNSAWPWARC